jgi:hypothetical protein
VVIRAYFDKDTYGLHIFTLLNSIYPILNHPFPYELPLNFPIQIGSIESVSFENENGTLNSLYEILKSFFTKENRKNKEYIRMFKLGDKNVYCANAIIFGNYIYFSVDGGFMYLTEKQVDKLFGKRK